MLKDNTSRRQLLKSLGLATSGIVLAGCSSDTDYEEGGNAGDGNSDSSDSNKQLEILSHEWYEEDYSAGVKGTAKNTSGETLGYVSVKAKFYDESDALIESSLDNVNDLEAGGEWKFDVMYPGTETDKVDSYEIGVGEGF